MIKKVMLAAMVAASLGAIPVTASAVVIVREAPPQPRSETTPPPRHGYIWVGGHWDWQGRHHQWVQGSWMRERRGYQYNPSTWVERDGRWHLERGQWRRGDRDGDGVPNRVDRAPNNPNRN